MTRKQKTSFALSPVALQLLKDLAKHLGISQAALIEMESRNLAEFYGITVQSSKGDQTNNEQKPI